MVRDAGSIHVAVCSTRACTRSVPVPPLPSAFSTRTSSVAISGVRRPIRLEQMPLLGRPTDERFELSGQALGAGGDVVAQLARPLQLDRRPHHAEVAATCV